MQKQGIVPREDVGPLRPTTFAEEACQSTSASARPTRSSSRRSWCTSRSTRPKDFLASGAFASRALTQTSHSIGGADVAGLTTVA